MKQLVKKHYERRTNDLGLKASRHIVEHSSLYRQATLTHTHYSAGPTRSMTQCSPAHCGPAVPSGHARHWTHLINETFY